MNIKDISLEEIELQSAFIEEGVSALLHTILFVRAPNLVKPEDFICSRLAPLTFAKCGPSDVDDTVREAISTLDKVRVPIGPHLSKGMIIISFFEKRETKGFFGLISNLEKVCFERWRIRVVINERPLPRQSGQEGGGTAPTTSTMDDIERQQLFDHARDQIQHTILVILETANKAIDHVPPSMYEYEIETTGPSGERRVGEQSIVTRLINSPMI